jgi:hypothetical protein
VTKASGDFFQPASARGEFAAGRAGWGVDAILGAVWPRRSLHSMSWPVSRDPICAKLDPRGARRHGDTPLPGWIVMTGR